MKKKMFIALMIMIWGTAVYSQTSSTTLEKYVVQKGDNTWNLSELRNNDPLQYKKIIQDNPFLKGRIRNEGPGKVFVDLTAGVDTLLLTPEQKALIHTVAPTQVKKLVTVAPVVKASWSNADIFLAWWTTSGWKWLVGVSFALLVIFLLGRLSKSLTYKAPEVEGEVFDDPITAGPAMVDGGVTDDTIESEIQNRYPNITLSNIQRGRLYGQGLTSYADGTEKRTIYKGEAGYRATATYANGDSKTVYFLQACGNDARREENIVGNIQFVPEVQIVDGVARPILMPIATVATVVNLDQNKIASEAIELAGVSGRKLSITVEDGKMSIEIAEEKNPLLPEMILGFVRKNGEDKVEETKFPVTASDSMPGSKI